MDNRGGDDLWRPPDAAPGPPAAELIGNRPRYDPRAERQRRNDLSTVRYWWTWAVFGLVSASVQWFWLPSGHRSAAALVWLLWIPIALWRLRRARRRLRQRSH